MHQSIATIDSPEFINLQPLDINPLMSKCEIKVLYIGENRNHSFISKEIATEMAKTLRGAPIVGYFKKDKQDFADHGEKIIFDDEGIHFECQTRPYGFVSPDAKVWFQKFKDKDHLDNEVEREYLMTTGFLWTGQYEECKLAVEDEGRPQSMELDEETVKGQWSTNYNSNMEFFIINDAIFSKLCILGEDVEPCFEGSSVTGPNISMSFTKVDDKFRKTLYTMMQELRFALEGGRNMLDNSDVKKNSSTNEENLEAEDKNNSENIEENQKDVEEEGTSIETTDDNIVPQDSFSKNENKEKNNSEKENKDNTDQDKEKYNLLKKDYDELSTKYSEMQKDYQILKQFKADVEDKEKDALIKRFYMLDSDDIKEIISNKSKYSLEEIESKLSIIYTKKKLAAEEEEQNGVSKYNKNITTYSLVSDIDGLPDWMKEVYETEKNLKN